MNKIFKGFEGIWNGEYINDSAGHEYKTNVKPVPFILRIKEAGIIGAGTTFHGICQDDPAITNITTHSKVYGTIELTKIFFIKLAPKTHAFDQNGNLLVGDDPHPEIVYEGNL